MSKAKYQLSIAFYRPHKSIFFKNTVQHMVNGESWPHKYETFFDHILSSNAKVSVCASLVQDNGWKGLLRRLIEPVELILWVIGNRISLKKINFSFSKRSLENYDVLFFMHYGNFAYEDETNALKGRRLADSLSDIEILKVGHLTHYAYQPVIGSNNLERVGVNILVAENNLLNNSEFYRRYFGQLNSDFWCLSYIAANRFKSLTPFKSRSAKLVATGSITYRITDPEFVNFFQTDELQPLRRQIYDQAVNYTVEIESMIGDLNQARTSGKESSASKLRRIVSRFLPHPHLSYYKKDIVDIYNSYMMFAVPEEVCDLPGIGFVEGMACGCAFFGLDSPMYRDLGMVPGVHYVAHDGTLEGLLEKIRFYQQPTQLSNLEEIAYRGCKFVSENLRGENVYRDFLDRLVDRVMGSQAIKTT